MLSRCVISMLYLTFKDYFLSSPQARPLRAAPQRPAPRTPRPPLTTWGPAPCTACLPNSTASTALRAANLPATSLCPPWLTPPPRPPPLPRLSLATQLVAPTPRRYFLPSCTPLLLSPAPVPKVQSHPGRLSCSGCSRRRSSERRCCLLPPRHRRRLLPWQAGCHYASIAWRWLMETTGESLSTASTAYKVC